MNRARHIIDLILFPFRHISHVLKDAQREQEALAQAGLCAMCGEDPPQINDDMCRMCRTHQTI